MVRDTHKLKHDPTLAFDIFAKINNNKILLSLLIKHYPQQTKTLLKQLREFHGSKGKAEVPIILSFLDNFENECHQFKGKLSRDEQKNVQSFFCCIANWLEAMEPLLTSGEVKISGPIDRYVLSKTTYLIVALQTFIEPKPSKQESTPFFSNRKDLSKLKRAEEEAKIAKNLTSICKEIRKQIGSKETMPKGLVINLMVHLCQAIGSCQDNEPSSQFKAGLFECISDEINQVRALYPELAKAGEDLQKAIAKYQLQKP